MGKSGDSTFTAPVLLPPQYRFSKGLGQMLPSLYGQSLPRYQGQWQPSLSPTQQRAISMLQGRSVAQAPQQLQQAAGIAGQYANAGRMPSMLGQAGNAAAGQQLLRFMNPQFNPAQYGLRNANVPQLYGGGKPNASKFGMEAYPLPGGGGEGQPVPYPPPGGGGAPPPQGGGGNRLPYSTIGNTSLVGRVGSGGGGFVPDPRNYGAAGGMQARNMGSPMALLSAMYGGAGQGATGGGLRAWNQQAGFTPNLSVNPFAQGLTPQQRQQAGAARWGEGYWSANNPRPVSHGDAYASMDRINQGLANNTLSPAVRGMLSEAGINGPVNSLGYADLSNFQRGNSTFLQDINNQMVGDMVSDPSYIEYLRKNHPGYDINAMLAQYGRQGLAPTGLPPGTTGTTNINASSSAGTGAPVSRDAFGGQRPEDYLAQQANKTGKRGYDPNRPFHI